MKQAVGWGVVVVTGIFVIFNLERAHVWCFGIKVDMPIALVVIVSAGLGALGTYAFTSLKGKS